MNTVIVIGVGLVLLSLCALVGRFVGGTGGAATGVLVCLPLWFVGAAVNMYIGVSRAGYSFSAEAPIFLVVFAAPAAVALFVRRSFR